MQYAPFMEVLPRKYRFRILNSCMSRFIKLALSWNWTAVPFQFICNDGNLVVNPIDLLELDEQGIAERYDIVVDFSKFRIGDRIYLVNLLKQTDGRKPNGPLSLREAMAGIDSDPTVGPLLEFRVVGQVNSVDVPGYVHKSTTLDKSVVPVTLTQQIPIVQPVRTRVVEFGRSGDVTSRGPDGQCTPDCPDTAPEFFPWTIKVNGEACALLQRQSHLALDPQAGRDRTLDLCQRRRRLGPSDPPAFRGRHHHEPGDRSLPGHREPGAQGCLAAAARRAGCSSRSSSASTAAPTSTIATTPCTRTSPC